jgi:hypothetical protein
MAVLRRSKQSLSTVRRLTRYKRNGTNELPMTYMKLVTGGVKPHLCLVDQPGGESLTLCGCILTRIHNWKRIGGLEGDECMECAELAFGGHKPVSTPQESHASR